MRQFLYSTVLLVAGAATLSGCASFVVRCPLSEKDRGPVMLEVCSV